MEEFCAQGPVLYTTTTRIHPPDPSEGSAVISSDNLPLLKIMVDRIGRSCPHRPYKLVVTRNFMSPNLLRGVPTDFGDELERDLFRILLNEADGAASYSLKLPREGEPVLMNKAEYLVPVIGIDCLDQALGPDVLFRWHAFAELFSLKQGERITADLAAGILMHKQGVCKDWKPGSMIVPFINKVDSPAQDSAAVELARSILRNGNFPVQRVVFGSVLRERADCLAAP